MPTTNLSFAKVVATPTASSWSQSYNAAGLFTVVSLSTDDDDLQTELPTHGKQLLNNIQAEFFGLEDKSFEKISQALSQTTKDLPDQLSLSLTVAYVKEDALYCFIMGSGRVTLKRGEQIGTVLHHTAPDELSRETVSASGYLESDDIILLETHDFTKSVSAKTLNQALEFSLPSDIAETISPHVHGGSNGGASALIISYKGGPRIPEDDEEIGVASTSSSSEPVIHHAPSEMEGRNLSQEEMVEDTRSSGQSRFKDVLSRLPLPHAHLDPRRKIILSLALLITGVLLVSIFFVQSSRESSKNHALFETMYNSAKKDYDEGEGLIELNKSLARDDYLAAKKTLDEAEGKFKEGSDEANQIAELTALVDKRLSETEGVSKVEVSEVSDDDAPVLALLKESTTLASAENEDSLYTLTAKEIVEITKSNDAEDSLIKNDDTWVKPVSMDDFGGNLYVLDQSEGLLKFVPTASGMAASSYFSSDEPDLSKAISLSIDSSIYILFSDGTITKYTRGTQDSFSVSGLDDGFITPKAIYTSPDLSSLYVLDPGGSRIVKLSTSGQFLQEYQASPLKDAQALTVSSDEKSAFVLSGDKIYKLSL